MIKRTINIIIGIALILVLIFSIKKNINEKKSLKENGILLTGKIVDVSSSKNYSFKCKFIYKGKQLIRRTKSGVKKSTYFLGQNFPFIYSPEKDIIQILMTPEEFNDYGMSFPDSLNWVLEDKY